MPAPASLITTKLYLPPSRPNRVPRPRLLTRLNENLPITVLAAPAGFGKTTLLSEWIASSAGRVAWLSLDEGDNDPAGFWTYAMAALQTLGANPGQNALASLQAAPGPAITLFLTALINEVAAFAEPFVLVLDDYHVIAAQPIHDALEFLINHLPPPMHLVIASRADPALPLAQLRARGQLTELRADDLRFTPDEAAAFLNQSMALKLTTDQIAQLESRTEGWIAGLQLAALSMRDRDDRAEFITAFTGSHRFVADYLVEQVLARQPEEVQTFLLQTAILDRLCAALCQEVTGRDDSQAIIERLERANLFLIALDEERQWYRYHRLFADVLRARLQQSPLAAQSAALHRRASAWHALQGLGADAIHHALAGHDVEAAARMIEQSGIAIIFGGQAQTVLAWLSALPEAQVQTHPLLAVTYALALMLTNQLVAGLAWMQAAEQAIRSDTPVAVVHTIRGWGAVYRSELGLNSGDLESAGAIARDALAQGPMPATARLALMVRVARGYEFTGDVSANAERLIAETIEPVRATGNVFTLLNSITFLARLQVLQGHLRQASRTYAEAVRASPPGMAVISPAYYFGLADVLREQNQLHEAERLLAEGLNLARGTLSIDADVLALGQMTLARLKQARGDRASAQEVLREFEIAGRHSAFFPPLVTSAIALQARIALANGQAEAAAAWADRSGLGPADPVAFVRETEYLTLARVWIRHGKAAEALRLLDRWLADAEAKGRGSSVIEILILRALALQTRDDIPAALQSLGRALALAEPEGYLRIFLDEGQPLRRLLARMPSRAPYADRLLAALGTMAPGNPAAGAEAVLLAEPLRPRELEILRLIAEGLSNREIADRLYLGVGTVKTHVINLFRKLGVTSRTQALARARELGLLQR